MNPWIWLVSVSYSIAPANMWRRLECVVGEVCPGAAGPQSCFGLYFSTTKREVAFSSQQMDKGRGVEKGSECETLVSDCSTIRGGGRYPGDSRESSPGLDVKAVVSPKTSLD